MSAEPDYGYIFGALRNVSDSNDHSRFRIQDLPPTLLAEVFRWYILFVHAARSRYRDQPTPYAWLVIRHVCRAWRAVALGYPHLSSYIYISDNAKCVQAMLAQSGTALLHIYGDPAQAPPSRVKTQRTVLEHLHRTVFAQVMLLHPDDDANAPEIPAVPRHADVRTSAMRSLTVQCRSVSRPFVLFAGYAFPHLQEFKSTAVPLRSYRALLHSGLRSLSLSRTVPSYDLDEFIVLLNSLPQLEALAVDNLIDLHQRGSLPSLPVPRTPRPRATLDRLSTVHARDSCLVQGCYIFAPIAYPGSAAVRLSFEGLLIAESVPEHTSEILLAKFKSPGSASPQTMLLSCRRPTATRVAFWDDRLPIQDVKAWREDDASYALAVDATPPSFLAEPAHHLPLSTLRAVRLQELGTSTIP